MRHPHPHLHRAAIDTARTDLEAVPSQARSLPFRIAFSARVNKAMGGKRRGRRSESMRNDTLKSAGMRMAIRSR